MTLLSPLVERPWVGYVDVTAARRAKPIDKYHRAMLIWWNTSRYVAMWRSRKRFNSVVREVHCDCRHERLPFPIASHRRRLPSLLCPLFVKNTFRLASFPTCYPNVFQVIMGSVLMPERSKVISKDRIFILRSVRTDLVVACTSIPTLFPTDIIELIMAALSLSIFK